MIEEEDSNVPEPEVEVSSAKTGKKVQFGTDNKIKETLCYTFTGQCKSQYILNGMVG